MLEIVFRSELAFGPCTASKEMLFYIFFSIFFFQKSLATEYKIGLAVWSGYPQSVQGFKDGLAIKGLVDGKNISFIQGEVGADKILQRKVANSFKEESVDLVFTLTTPGTTIIKEVMPIATPLVFSIVTYPADSGLIESFEYSGNNLVGKHSQKFEPIFGGAKPHGMILEMVSKTLEANGHHNYASQSQHLCLQ